MSNRGDVPRLAVLGAAVEAPLPTSALRGAAVPVAHSCRSCGAALERIGAFYWHAERRARCPITCWPASSIERTPTRAAPPAAALVDTLEGALTMSKRGGNKVKRPPKAPMTNRGPKPK